MNKVGDRFPKAQDSDMESLREGIKDSFIFGVSFIFLYLSIGASGFAMNLSFFETLSTTLFIFSTPLQFLLVKSYSDGWILIPLILAMNARFLLMSATLSPYFKHAKLHHILFSLMLIVPSVFSACIAKFKKPTFSPFYYFLGIGIPIWLISIISTIIGYITGSALQGEEINHIISLVLPLQFTGLAAKHYPNLKEVGSYFAGFFLAPLMLLLTPTYNLLILPFVIGVVVLLGEEMLKIRDLRKRI